MAPLRSLAAPPGSQPDPLHGPRLLAPALHPRPQPPDQIVQRGAAGQTLGQAVVDAAAVRAKPIVLTGVAAMVGGFFIIDDPIFQGLAVSLIFGILVSTALTLLVIPLLYYGWLARSTPAPTGPRKEIDHE